MQNDGGGGNFLMFDIQTKGLQSAISGLERFTEDMKDLNSIEQQLSRLADAMVADLVEATPVGETGVMQNSWKKTMFRSKGEVGYNIVNTAEYAGFVVQGTGVYGPNASMIRAPEGKMFVFMYQGAKWVIKEHAGQVPNKELNLKFEELPDMQIRAVDRILRGLVDVYFGRKNEPFMNVHEAEMLQNEMRTPVVNDDDDTWEGI